MKYPTVEHVQTVTDFKTRVYAEGAIEALKWLENGAPHKLDGLKGRFNFNMSEFITVKGQWNDDTERYGSCGTACCIAGAIYAFSKKMNGDRRHAKCASDLDEAFGVIRTDRNADYDPLAKLFYGILPNNKQLNLNNITPEAAAITLRKYLETGVVDWGHFNEI